MDLDEMANASSIGSSHAHWIFALISVACPFIGLALVSIYQAYTYEDFWRPHTGPIDDADVNAGAMMSAVILVELFLSIGAGSIVGLVFAGISLKHKARILSLGTAALTFNLIPVLFVIRLYVWGL